MIMGRRPPQFNVKYELLLQKKYILGTHSNPANTIGLRLPKESIVHPMLIKYLPSVADGGPASLSANILPTLGERLDVFAGSNVLKQLCRYAPMNHSIYIPADPTYVNADHAAHVIA